MALRVADAGAGHVLSMALRSCNGPPQRSFTGNVHGPLVGRDRDVRLVVLLATSRKQTVRTV